MAISYRTAKFKSANIFAMAQPPDLIPANISGYTYYMMQLELYNIGMKDGFGHAFMLEHPPLLLSQETYQ